MRNIIIYIFFFLLFTSVNSQNQEKIAANSNLDKKGIAIKGYDPVSYFEDDPRLGKSVYSYKYGNINYYFQNEKYKNIFIATPQKYIPEYGGWCAYAMGDSGEKVEVNPKTYKIINGKLYLFYNKYFTNTLDDWNKDEKRLKKHGDKNWNNIVKP